MIMRAILIFNIILSVVNVYFYAATGNPGNLAVSVFCGLVAVVIAIQLAG